MKRTPLRRVSKKRSKQLRDYSKLRKRFLEDFPICQVCFAKNSEHVHHKQGRFAERLNDTEYWLATCWDCHSDIHAKPAWAKEKGFLLLR